MEKFRVLSDLHMDINSEYPFEIDDKDIFTVVAGDTSGEYAIIDAKCDNSAVKVYVKDSFKASNFFGKSKNPIVRYNASDREWKYRGKTVNNETSGIDITFATSMCFGNVNSIKDKTEVRFSIFRVTDWIKNNIHDGIMIAGNHLVYNREGKTIEELKNRLHDIYGKKSNVTFLDNSVGLMTKEKDGILFIGSTLYTNYELPINDYRYRGKERPDELQDTIETNMRLASPKMSGGGLNDFNFGKTSECTYRKADYIESDSDVSFLTPKNYLNFFHRTFDEIKRIVSENKDKEIVIVTHHCPSPKCISKNYVDDDMNSSYVSDLESFIKDNPNIKCWICGHVHHRDNFRIGNCLVVMNPLGYCPHGQFMKDSESSYEWSPDVFVNVKTWDIEINPIEKVKEWNEKYEIYRKKREEILKKYYGMFFV